MASKKNLVLSGIAILLIASISVAAALNYSDTFNNNREADSPGTEKADEQTNNKYSTLRGDDFDATYIGEMIAHHEGAVSMAEQAIAMTSRQEIRTLAEGIMQSQSQEIGQMRDWQKEWNYTVTSGGHAHHSASGSGMSGDMAQMQSKLDGLEGEAYDREFLKQMILHHEQAIEMSRYASTNAGHQEVKDLAASVTTAQKKEVEQMKEWQKLWSY